MTTLRITTVAAFAAVLMAAARPALAGPPLICFPFQIGDAKTLPMGSAGWHDTDPGYDVSRLVADTVALLGADTPVIVRMETLRRATLYAAKDRQVADALLQKLEARASARQPSVGLGEFDFGYLVESYKQAAHIQGTHLPDVVHIDGYGIVAKSLAFQSDPEIEFAAAIMAHDPSRKAYQPEHLRKAASGAKTNPRLAQNLGTHFNAGSF